MARLYTRSPPSARLGSRSSGSSRSRRACCNRDRQAFRSRSTTGGTAMRRWTTSRSAGPLQSTVREDRHKIGQYLDAVRDVERRIQKAEEQSSRVTPTFQRAHGGSRYRRPSRRPLSSYQGGGTEIWVYPGFPTIFRGLSGFFVGDLRKRPCGSSWKTRSVFHGAVGALCASTAPSASTGPVRVRQNGSRGGNGELDRRRPRTAVDP